MADRKGDLCIGMKAIAEHLGITQRQGFRLDELGKLPTFKIQGSKSVCARRSELDRWLDDVARLAVEGDKSVRQAVVIETGFH